MAAAKRAAKKGAAKKAATKKNAATKQREVPSGEADKQQLKMARDEGAAYQRSLTYMVKKVAHTGAKKTVGDYIVGIAQEEAEGMYRPNSQGRLVWKKPQDENCHLEISVSDVGDKRFIPGLQIEAELVSKQGDKVGPFAVPFLWHPGLYHYGANIKVPGDGKYDVKVKIEPPAFARHDKRNGRRFAKTVNVKFAGVDIKTGQD